MIIQILKTILVAALFAAFATTGIAQQPFDTLPADEQQVPPQENKQDEPIRIPTDDPMRDSVPSTPFSSEGSAFQDDEPDQTVEVNERFAGWEAAGEGSNGGRLSDTLRGSWVMADSNGLLVGNVRGVAGADTANMFVFLLNRGRLVTNDLVDEYGDFEFNNVVEGAYSLIGIGENAFFAFGLNVLDFTENDERTVPTRLDVSAFQNKTNINLDWIRYFSPVVEFRVYGRYSAEEGPDNPASLYGFQGLTNNAPPSVPATSINSHKVVLAKDGRLLGRIHQINSLSGRPVNILNTKVMLLKGDDVYAPSNTDNYGVFEFADVEPGEYALVAASVDGLGCIGIEVVEADQTSVLQSGDEDDSANGEATTISSAGVFDFTMVPSESVGWLNHIASELAYERAILAPRAPKPPECPPCQWCRPKVRKGFLRKLNESINTAVERRFYGEDPTYRTGGNSTNY